MAQQRIWHNDEKISPPTVTSVCTPTRESLMHKRSLKADGHDERIETALEDLRKKKFKSINAAAKAYGVSEAIL